MVLDFNVFILYFHKDWLHVAPRVNSAYWLPSPAGKGAALEMDLCSRFTAITPQPGDEQEQKRVLITFPITLYKNIEDQQSVLMI